MNENTPKDPVVPAFVPWIIAVGSLLCLAYSYNPDPVAKDEQATQIEQTNSRYSIPVPLDNELKCDEAVITFGIGSTSVPMESFDSPESTIESLIKCYSTQGTFSPVTVKNTMQIDNAKDAILIPNLVDFYRENEYAFDVFEDKQQILKCTTGHCIAFDIPDEAFIKSQIDPTELSLFYSYVLNDALDKINKEVDLYIENKAKWGEFKRQLATLEHN